MAKSNSMAFTKSQTNLQHLSPREQSLFEIIPAKPKSITSKELVDLYYGPNPPFNALKIIVGRVNGMAAKLVHFKATWRIMKVKPDGLRNMTYWREKA